MNAYFNLNTNNNNAIAVALEDFLQNFLESGEDGEARTKYVSQLVRVVNSA